MTRRILGLDLGSHSVKAVEFRQTWTGFEVAQLRELPVPDSPVELPEALRAFVRAHDLPTEHVVAAVPGDRLSLRRLSFPFRGRKEIAQAVPFAVEEQVPFDLEDICLDWALLGGDRSHSEVVTALAPRSEVARVLEALQASGIDPRVLECEGLALGNLALQVDLSGTRLLLDLGHRKTTLCLCVDGRPVAARTVPVAGRALTEAIARERRLSLEDAERLKCEEGLFREGLQTDLPGSVAVLDRLARELVRTLGSLEPVAGDPASTRLEEIVICGGTAHLHKLDEYLAERIGIPTVRLAFPPGETGSALLAGGDPMRFGPAVALALRGTSGARTHMNFRQAEFSYRRDLSELRRQLRPTTWLAAAAALLLAVSLGADVMVESRRARALRERAQQLYAQVFPGRPAPAGSVPDAMRRAVRDAHERAEFLGVYRGNLSALDLLGEISRLVPEDLDVVFDELSIDRQVVRVRGHTTSFEAVDRIQAELRKYPVFSQIRVAEIQSDERSGGKSFSVTISLAAEGEA